MNPIGVKKLIIKLGGECNLKCPHCHCQVPEFAFNPKLIDWIRSEPVESINFNGGEPLMYFDRIRSLVGTLGDEYEYKFVTNGTLLTSRIIEFCNEHSINIIVSFDGEDGARDRTREPRWELMRFASRCALSVYTSGSKNVFSVQEDVNRLADTFLIRKIANDGSVMPNFLHETGTTGRRETDEDVHTYLKSLAQMVELQILQYRISGELSGKHALVKSVRKWLMPKDVTFGVACCSNQAITVTLDGRFMLCPYKNVYCGDIEKGPDIAFIESRIPRKCRLCPIFDVCRNTCIENTTSHECFIARKMNAHLKKLEAKYELDLVKLVRGVV